MLVTRIITAVVLLAVILPALFLAPPAVFNGLALVFIAAAAWEWARLSGLVQGAALATGVGCAAACGLAWQSGAFDGSAAAPLGTRPDRTLGVSVRTARFHG